MHHCGNLASKEIDLVLPNLLQRPSLLSVLQSRYSLLMHAPGVELSHGKRIGGIFGWRSMYMHMLASFL